MIANDFNKYKQPTVNKIEYIVRRGATGYCLERETIKYLRENYACGEKKIYI